MFVLRRASHNPIILPRKEHHWEAYATFNWCPVRAGNNTHVLYRAMAFPELLSGGMVGISTVGFATSVDGNHFENRRRLIIPEHGWEQFGCEDPRVTELDGVFYIFYTALSTFPFSADGIKVALAKTRDFKTIEEKHLITPFNAKAMALFPRKINGKFVAVLTVNTDRPPSKIAFAHFNKESDMWSSDYWNKWYQDLDKHAIDPRRSDKDHVEVGAPPVYTDKGWLLIYSHIQNYFGGERVFGIEALLLDHENPQEIIGRTSGAMMVPEELYEKHGNIPNIAFPSGALVSGENLDIYYGAADTTCCLASVNLNNLVDSIEPTSTKQIIKRHERNPILEPIKSNDWESKAVFNPAAIELENKVHILYRAMSSDNTSTIGYAVSKNGLDIDERLPSPIYVPREEFEQKKRSGNSGCEDPRIVRIGNRLYIFYTAFNGLDAPRVAVSSIEVSNFIAREWNWSVPNIITPPGIMDKDAVVLPEKISGKYMLIHRISDVICVDIIDNIDFENEKVTRCIQLIKPRPGMWDSRKVGIAAPPIKTPEGWILFYHGVSSSGIYRVGATLLDKTDPTTVLSRTTVPLLTPQEDYELRGQVDNVVFPCGAVERDGTIYIYYGGADSTVAVATIKTEKLFEILTK